MELKHCCTQDAVVTCPNDWNHTTFGDLYHEPARNGMYKSSAYQGRGTRIVNMGEMFGFEFISDQEMSRVALTSRELSASGLQDGDLLFGRRSVVPAGAGKCSLVVAPSEPVTFESSIIRVRLDKAKVYPLFYYYFFASPPGRRLVSTIVAGTNVKGIRSTELRELRIPIPTKTEQETIADALSDADALIASVQQLLTKKRNLKQGAMHELLTGKRRLPGFATSKGCAKTEVGMLPEDWEVTTVREVAATVRNAIVGGPFGSDLVSNDYVEEGVPVIRGQNLGFRFVTGSFVFVTPAKAHSLESNLARPSDLVFTQRGTLGQISLVPDEPFDRYLVSQSQMKLTLDRRSADPGFFYYLFSSSKQQEFIRQNTIQTGVPHINLGILRAIPVQRPSLVEQKAIAAILSEMDAEIAALEAKLTKSRQIKQGMMQELLTGRIRLV